MPVLKEDFMRWCDKCKKTGKVTIVHEMGGWMKIKEREIITCPKCSGKKIFFDQELYVLALEARVEKLESMLRCRAKIDEIGRKLDIVRHRLSENDEVEPDGMAGIW